MSLPKTKTKQNIKLIFFLRYEREGEALRPKLNHSSRVRREGSVGMDTRVLPRLPHTSTPLPWGGVFGRRRHDRLNFITPDLPTPTGRRWDGTGLNGVPGPVPN